MSVFTADGLSLFNRVPDCMIACIQPLGQFSPPRMRREAVVLTVGNRHNIMSVDFLFH